MFSSSSSKGKSKSSGLRILWIPGGRKSHPKGRYSSTNKNVSYNTQPKRKNESWSLGGSRNQKGLLEADPDTALLDGPSVSGLSAASCALGTAGVVGKCIKSEEILSVETHTQPATPAGENTTTTNGTGEAAVTTTVTTTTTETATETENASSPTTTTTGTATENGPTTGENPAQNIRPPSTPDSTTSTAPLLSPTFPSANNIEMPSKTATKASTHTTTVTTITKADVIDQENRFAILDDDLHDVVQLHRMRTLPRGDDEVSLQRNSLADTPQTPSSSSVITSRSSSSASPQHSTANSNTNSDSNHSSPVKKKHHRQRNHNNNHQQVITDLNTIESIHEESKIPNGSVDWIDDLVKDSTGEGDSVSTAKPKIRKKRNSKDMDQLDGVSKKSISPSTDDSDDGDEKFVTCLHYTLMCCDCSIS